MTQPTVSLLRLTALFCIVRSLLLSTPALADDQKVQFNCDRSAYPAIHQKIYKDEAKLFALLNDPTFQKTDPQAKGGDYCLAMLDLQDNAKPAIMRYADYGSYGCSASDGCSVDAFSVDAKGKWTNILNVITIKDGVTVLDRKVNGYHVLAIQGPHIRDLWTYSPEKRTYVENRDLKY